MANPTPLGETYLISPRGGAPVAHAGRWVLGLATLRLTCLPGPGRFGMCGSLQRTFWTPTAHGPLARRSPLWGVKAAGVPPRGLSPRLSRLHHILNVVSPDL